MSDPATHEPWGSGRFELDLPSNVRLGAGSAIVGDEVTCRGVFAHFKSRRQPALEIGKATIADGVAFNLGENATVRIGNDCKLEDAYLIAEEEIVIGDRVRVGWHATLVDSDLHPVQPEPRERDVRALSPLGDCRRVLGKNASIRVGDDVWIGPLAVILKGVSIGQGAIIEAGSVVTHDVPAQARVAGNPARVMEGGVDEL
jgi:acetyltransferase-like isoleucine patch superfamily enzyme